MGTNHDLYMFSVFVFDIFLLLPTEQGGTGFFSPPFF